MRYVLAIAALVACSGGSRTPVTTVKPGGDTDPTGPHREAIRAQIQPMIDAELSSSIVVGIYDAGKLEIYGFGKGPGGAPPNGRTIYDLGAVTKVYTALLFADAVQRREVSLDTAAGDLLPPGVTAPTKDNRAFTLHHLVNHTSGLPPLPPSIMLGKPDPKDPLAGYDENRLYADLVQTQLISAPGERITISEYGTGLLGALLGKRIGASYADAVKTRILEPLGLADTSFALAPAQVARHAEGTTLDLAPVKPWSWGALAGAGGLMSTVRDQLTFLEAELDGAAGSSTALRGAMRFTQEAQLASTGPNMGLAWQIDRDGRYWHNGTTNGFHAFVGFDAKARRAMVILASSATPIVDQVSIRLYKILAGEDVKPPTVPTAAQLASYAGNYDFMGSPLKMFVDGKRLYVEGPGEPRMRMLPVSDTEFWIPNLQAMVVFQKNGEKITRAVFVVGDQQVSAMRTDILVPQEPKKP